MRSLLTPIAALTFAGLAPAATLAAPPPTAMEVVRDTLHGTVLEDPYRWLEDQNAPPTRAWIETQNGYTDQVMKGAPGFDKIHARLEKMMRVESMGVPRHRAGFYFYTRRRIDQDQSTICEREGINGAERVLVDPNAMSPDHSLSVAIADIDDHARLLAYSIRSGGQDETQVAFKDLESGKDLTEVFPKARYFGISIEPSARGVYYAKQTREGPRIQHHSFGTDPASDRVVFGEGLGPEMIAVPSLSDDGRWLLITVNRGSTGEHTELWLQELGVGRPARPLVDDLDASFSARWAGRHLYVDTNWNAPQHRILEIDPENPSRERWHELVPERPHVIQGMSAIGGRLFVTYLENVVPVIRVFSPEGLEERQLSFPTLGTPSQPTGEWDHDEAFYTFVTFHIPTIIYRYQVSTLRRNEWWRERPPVNADRYVVRQAWFNSKDGTRVPMFVGMKKGLKLDGSNPTLLTGYGGFNNSQLPNYSARSALWMESGGVFVLANLRGGDEFGERWHRAGMLAQKQNVFDDFIAAADFLIKNRYTRSDRLGIWGRSNGGLLVGAAITQRPELFGAAWCGYPLLDMVRYHRFLVARFWVPEYGSAEDPAQFATLLAYSPYHHVKPGTKYPAVLFTTGDSDTRVAPLHARKMAARLQAATSSDRPILLHYDTSFGHVSGQPISKQIDDLTTEVQFLLWQLGALKGEGGVADRSTR